MIDKKVSGLFRNRWIIKFYLFAQKNRAHPFFSEYTCEIVAWEESVKKKDIPTKKQ